MPTWHHLTQASAAPRLPSTHPLMHPKHNRLLTGTSRRTPAPPQFQPACPAAAGRHAPLPPIQHHMHIKSRRRPSTPLPPRRRRRLLPPPPAPLHPAISTPLGTPPPPYPPCRHQSHPPSTASLAHGSPARHAPPNTSHLCHRPSTAPTQLQWRPHMPAQQQQARHRLHCRNAGMPHGHASPSGAANQRRALPLSLPCARCHFTSPACQA